MTYSRIMSDLTVEINARAKINLNLHITGKRGDMHLLDTVITPVSLYDTLYLSKRADGKISVLYDGKENKYERDTALLTAELIAKKYGTGGVDINIVKRIPEGAGLGGSSADAAGVALGMEKLFDYGKTDPSLLSEVGSDVPAMYFGAPCRVRGTGDEITSVNLPKNIYFAVCTAHSGVSTKECYNIYDRLGGENGDCEKTVEAILGGEYFYPTNDLYPAAVTVNPEVKILREAVEKAGFISGMTGSGCAVFGYEYGREAFERKLSKLKISTDGKFKIYALCNGQKGAGK